jgi:hypothetical protein
MSRSPRQQAYNEILIARESHRRSRIRRVSTSRYSRALLSWTLLFLVLLIVRAIAVTTTVEPRGVQIHETWSLLVSLQIDDYINVMYGLVATNAPLLSIAVIIIAWSVWRAEGPVVYLDSQWTSWGPTLLLSGLIVLPAMYLLLFADWWWKIAGVVVALAIYAYSLTTGRPPSSRQEPKEAYLSATRS